MEVGCTPSFPASVPFFYIMVSMENWCKLQWFLSCFPSRGLFLPARHDWIAPRFLCQLCLCELTFYCTFYSTLKPNVKHKGFNSTPEIHCPNKGDNFFWIHPPFLPGFIPWSSTFSSSFTVFPLGLGLFSSGNVWLAALDLQYGWLWEDVWSVRGFTLSEPC